MPCDNGQSSGQPPFERRSPEIDDAFLDYLDLAYEKCQALPAKDQEFIMRRLLDSAVPLLTKEIRRLRALKEDET